LLPAPGRRIHWLATRAVGYAASPPISAAGSSSLRQPLNLVVDPGQNRILDAELI
jgi:hypothetical protein